MLRPIIAVTLLLAFGVAAREGTAQDGGLVRVFVLAGQSNMEGKAQNILLEHQAAAEATAEEFAPWRDGDGWIAREDVFIRFGNRRGALTIGYGSPKRTGAELEFGRVMGERFEDPVLLIKTAWGGHSLFQKFRPPSSGMPDDARLEAELANAIQRATQRNEKQGRDDPMPTMEDIRAPYGSSYRRMLEEVRDTLDNLDAQFPALSGRVPKVEGFVWFQGWNDQYGGVEVEYGEHLANLVRDVRKDLGVEGLPVVVAAMGQHGSEPVQGPMKVIQDAQLAIAEDPEFRASVRSIRTDVLVDTAAEALYPRWKDNLEEWQRTGSDHRYHYLGSALWFNRIGRAMAAAMGEMLDER